MNTLPISVEYTGALAILVVSLLQVFGIVVEKDAVVGIITGVLAIVVAVRRHSKGDIAISGVKL